MNDSLFMCRFECLGDLLGNWQRLVHRNWASRNPICKRLAFDTLHDERLHTIRLLQTVDVGNVRMIERGEHLRFSPESSESVGIRCEGTRQYLQGVVSIERSVMCSPDLAHPAFANQGG